MYKTHAEDNPSASLLIGDNVFLHELKSELKQNDGTGWIALYETRISLNKRLIN